MHQYAIAFLQPDDVAKLFGGDVTKEKNLQRFVLVETLFMAMHSLVSLG